MDMELRQLSYFVAVAEELHFNRAAARMCIAQRALSSHIQALEKELDVRLLERSTRRVELTRAGEVFHDRALRIIGDVGLSMDVARSVAGKVARTIKIGTVYPVTTGVLPAFLARIGRTFPDVALQLAGASKRDRYRGPSLREDHRFLPSEPVL
jgi:DNA-binding transcriptional LysR family regulator